MSNLLFDPIRTQASVTDGVIVGFSGGKDSIVTLDLCFRYFKTVKPFFMYLVRAKGKERMEEKNNLNWYSVIVFEDEKAKADFYKKINTPISEEYLTVDKVMRLAENGG